MCYLIYKFNRKEDYEKARVLLSEAVKSGSYLYPFRYDILYNISADSLALRIELRSD